MGCSLKFFGCAVLGVFLLGGCATTRPRQADSSDLAVQVSKLQAQIAAKDQEIQDLQLQIGSYRRALAGTNVAPAGKSRWIKARGVSVNDLQSALVAAGLDPGPIDGRMGKKTKAAVKAFQKKNGLKADGVVGEKTWSLLKRL